MLKLFEPHELLAVVTGNEDYDWQALQDTAEYRGGYSPTDPHVLAFWEVLHEMSDHDKRNFLLFLTGSDRIPIQGMKAIAVSPEHISYRQIIVIVTFNTLLAVLGKSSKWGNTLLWLSFLAAEGIHSNRCSHVFMG